MKKGILYVAIGELWIQDAILASRIVKKYMPSLPITIFADRAFNCEHVDQVVVAETGASPILTKTQWLAPTGWSGLNVSACVASALARAAKPVGVAQPPARTAE